MPDRRVFEEVALFGERLLDRGSRTGDRFVRPGEAPPLVEARANGQPGTFSVSFDAE